VFERLSYVGYTALFCVPPLALLWLRREFATVLRARLRPILLSTAVLTLYGSVLWPRALARGAWAYGPERVTGIELFGYVPVDDVFWWLLIGLLFSSFIALSTHYEDRGVDIVAREIRELWRSVVYALRGLGVIRLERNSTIHVAVAIFVLLEAILFDVSATEWALVALAIGFVVAAELVNSAVERVADRVGTGSEPEAAGSRARAAAAPGREGTSAEAVPPAPPAPDPVIAVIKDAAAAAVLVSAAAAAAVGLTIFLGRLLAALS